MYLYLMRRKSRGIMLQKLKSLKFVQSFQLLKGNTRASVLYEPLWGVPFTFFNFYLSLYLREMGVTDKQFGILIAAGFLSSAFFSLFGGVITDFLGRKKTSFIFDFISWPVSIFIYLLSKSMLLFIIAVVVNGTVKIVGVAWSLMVVEDADSEQRKVAYNLLNIINITVGIFTPLAGILVANVGIINGERIFMVFAILSMSAMVYFRNREYTETANGKRILAEHKGLKLTDVLKKGLYRGAIQQIFTNKRLGIVILLQVLFNLTLPLGGFNSLYFAPFMTEVLGIDKATVSVLGGVYAAVMLFVFLVINPLITTKHVSSSILIGLILQGLALLSITLIPGGVIFYAILAVGLYSFGNGIFLPFLSALVADTAEGREMAGIYSLFNTIVSIVSAIIGSVSGLLYSIQPRLIFLITVGLIVLCIAAMLIFIANEKHLKRQSDANSHIENIGA